MSEISVRLTPGAVPQPAALLELLKPITWFAPMWAFGCGLVAAGVPLAPHWGMVLLGVALCGPLVCGTSQAANDWYDREVDAINEPHRPIPSGRIPGRLGLVVAVVWSAVSLAVAALLGRWAFGATALGLALAWAYSAPPLRLKRNGWWGNAACAACYEGLPWFTGTALLSGGRPGWPVITLAALYSLGAHGIMTLNDFKSEDGDRRTGILSLPVQMGTLPAARFACVVMAGPQAIVATLLAVWGFPVHAGVIAALLAAQFALMPRFLRDPRRFAPWYQATGTSLYVLGMLASAFTLRALLAAGP